MNLRLIIRASPHLRGTDSTPQIMWTVVAGLVPVVGAAIYYFGPSALLVISASLLGAVGAEYMVGRPGALRDGSATITGVLLGRHAPRVHADVDGVSRWVRPRKAAQGGSAFALRRASQG